MRSSPEAWDNLIAAHGPEYAIAGGGAPHFWESGDADWKHNIRPHLEPLGETPVVLEWGAGVGRVARAALADGVEVWAYEPSTRARSAFLNNPDLSRAYLLTPDCLSAVDHDFTHIFSWWVLHNIDFDDVWDFLRFAGQHLAPGGVLLFDYIDITSEIAEGFMRRKDGSDWPSYMWHPEQLHAMLRFHCPDLTLHHTVERARRVEVWHRA